VCVCREMGREGRGRASVVRVSSLDEIFVHRSPSSIAIVWRTHANMLARTRACKRARIQAHAGDEGLGFGSS
jgi:hypothetical protein